MCRFFSYIFAFYDSPWSIGYDEINKKKSGCIIHVVEIELSKSSQFFVEITIMTRPPIYKKEKKKIGGFVDNTPSYK